MVNPSDFSNPWVSLYKRNIPMKTARSKRLKYYCSSKSGHPILACLFKNSLTDCGKTERKRKTQPSRTCCHHLEKRSRDYLSSWVCYITDDRKTAESTPSKSATIFGVPSDKIWLAHKVIFIVETATEKGGRE